MHQVSQIMHGTGSLIAPLGTSDCPIKHAGRADKKPWDYNVTAIIPHLNTPECLELVIELLRLQNERPYIMVIDTGSPPQVLRELESMRADDLEIHYIAAHGYMHSSEPVCAALDLAHALCRTKYLFHTHADLFLRRQDFIRNTMRVTCANTPVVGYRMSPRDWCTTDWEWMVGHTALLLYMPTMHRIGATWSMQRMHHSFHVPWQIGNGWPDTETGFNHILKVNGIEPVFIGRDRNYDWQKDDNISHVRSFPGMKLHAPDKYRERIGWMNEAMDEARSLIHEWSGGTKQVAVRQASSY